jgi:hypothetical protein
MSGPDSYVHAPTIAELVRTIRDFAKGGLIDWVDFHTHGGAGSISIGSEQLKASNMAEKVANKRLELAFNAGAQVVFQGCNVADGPWGELFVAGCGYHLLRKQGGKVKAHTGLGVAEPLYTGNVYHPFGNWVTAKVSPGGAVTLAGHRYLSDRFLKQRHERIRASLAWPYAVGPELTRKVEEILQSSERMAKARGGSSFARLALAHHELTRIDEVLRDWKERVKKSESAMFHSHRV